MTTFKYENCTSKQYVRSKGWIPEAKERLARLPKVSQRGPRRRLRYLTFCAEGAIDVLALRNAKIIKKSAEKLYDTVTFFDFAPQAVDKTLRIIEGANGFPIDFFELINSDYPEIPQSESDLDPQDAEEDDVTFREAKNRYLYGDFRRSFPFDLMNLDVERYVIRPTEKLPGELLTAWDKILEWQKREGSFGKLKIKVDEFTVFFTAKIGPRELPDTHRDNLIRVIEANIERFPDLKHILSSRFSEDNAEKLYHSNFDEFFKLAVPKALISRALAKDWMLDLELSYKAFEFDRQPPASDEYTMVHYILHFRRCAPSLDAQINPLNLPLAVAKVYGESVTRVFTTPCDDVDVSKMDDEATLKMELGALGVAV